MVFITFITHAVLSRLLVVILASLAVAVSAAPQTADTSGCPTGTCGDPLATQCCTNLEYNVECGPDVNGNLVWSIISCASYGKTCNIAEGVCE
jgi:hypothetical protein